MKRTQITQAVLETIGDLMDSQDIKGFSKYGLLLDDVEMDEYNWDHMAMEEMADCIKYLLVENFKLRRMIKIMGCK